MCYDGEASHEKKKLVGEDYLTALKYIQYAKSLINSGFEADKGLQDIVSREMDILKLQGVLCNYQSLLVQVKRISAQAGDLNHGEVAKARQIKKHALLVNRDSNY